MKARALINAPLIICSLIFFLSVIQSSFAAPQDFDGDGLDDLTLFDATNAVFDVRLGQTGEHQQTAVTNVGGNPAGNVPAQLDRDGDGDTDPATFNRSTGEWMFDVNGEIFSETFWDGTPGNIPVPGKYHGNTCDDLGVYNPLTQTFTTKSCTNEETIVATFNDQFGGFPIVGDFDGDNTDDLATWDPQTGNWYIIDSSTQNGRSVSFGQAGDYPFAGDFEGDGTDDLMLFRPKQENFNFGVFGVYNAGDPANPWFFPWGLPGDIPNVLDTIGDGKTDISIFRAALGAFFVRTSQIGIDWLNVVFDAFSLATAALPIAPNQFIPPAPPGDFNRDGRSDFAVVQNSGGFAIWNFLLLDGNLIQVLFGLSNDTFLTGDIEGDKLVQPVVVRASNGFLDWYFRLSGGQEAMTLTAFGLQDDTPLLGDLDCDGKDDPILVRPVGPNLFWYWRNSSRDFADDGYVWAWGLADDTPFVADMTGDGCEEFVVARPFAGGMWWFAFSPRTARTVTETFGLENDTPFPPTDFDGNGTADPIILREESGQQVAYVLLGDIIRVINLGSSGTPAAGQFSGLKQAEFAVYNSGGSYGTDTVSLIRYDGATLLIGLPQSPGTGTVVAPNVVSSGVSPLGCSEVKSFIRPELYKPFSDAVAGHGVTLFDDSFWSRIAAFELYDRDNNYLGGDIRRKCCPNGNRAHYWLNQRSTTLQQFAPLTVKLTFTDGTNTCRIIPDPTRRYE